jgi:K+-sensing histidine kinase KdpD
MVVHPTKKRGMGLPTCTSILEAHDGTISVKNHGDGAGAGFTVTLPGWNPSR